MSVCLCSFRALSRSRTPNPKTLAPFLYQTPTIQQRNPVSCRNTSNPSHRPRPEHDVPFEGEELPPAVEDARASRKTTITGSERAAFEKLYKKFKKPEQKGTNEYELDQIADEYYEDDDDNGKDKSAESIDSLFDAVLAGRTPPKPPGHSIGVVDKRRKAVDLQTLVRQTLHPEAEEKRRKLKEEAAKKQARIKELRSSEKDRVKALLQAAPADQALWAVLEKEAFSVVRGMDLDTPNATGSFNRKSKTKTMAKNLPRSASSGSDSANLSPTDPTIFFPNYSYHLLTAARILRTNFPASPLVFNILPTIKDLGRSSYALGASTSLYKVIIRAAFVQNYSYAQICSLLQDMDNGGIEYDYGVVNLLDEILSTHWNAERGNYGRGMQAVMRLELYAEGVEKLRAWHIAVKERVGDFGEKKKMKGHLVRRMTHFKDNRRGTGPMDDILIGERNTKEDAGPVSCEYRKVKMTDEDIPLVDCDVPFVEEPKHTKDADEIRPDLKGFMQDTLEAPVEPLAEPPVEATIPEASSTSVSSNEEVTVSEPSSTSPPVKEENEPEKRTV